MTEKSYTTMELGAELGMDGYAQMNRLLNRFDKEGWLKPSVSPRAGSGSSARYSEEDLLVAQIVLDAVPVDTGSLSLRQSRLLIAQAVKEHLGTAYYLVVRDDSTAGYNSAHQVMADIDTHGSGLIIPLQDYITAMD